MRSQDAPTIKLVPNRSPARVPEEAPKDCPEVYVYPGHLLASANAVVASTILGTCVAVCLFDPQRRIGGLNHFMLPEAPRSAASSTRFGDVATHRLIDELVVLGATQLSAKVFGGMVGRLDAHGLARDLGERNADLARSVLARAAIPTVAEDTGGPQSRKLVFHTGDGRAWVRSF